MEREKGLGFLFALPRSVRPSPNENKNNRVGQLFMLFVSCSFFVFEQNRTGLEKHRRGHTRKKGAHYTSTSLFLTANNGHNNRKERGFLLLWIVKQRGEGWRGNDKQSRVEHKKTTKAAMISVIRMHAYTRACFCARQKKKTDIKQQ